MNPAIAIVGMACRYPDARSPAELWENALAGRRAFRRLPPERLRAEDYLSADKNAPDRTYTVEAAVIEGYEFDRVRFRVVGSTFRSADLAHWLALDVASQALADAGFAEGEGLPRETTGVLLGNTLTGEFSRANVMRLRWPYVRRVVDARLAEEGWPPEQRRVFLDGLETQYKAPFAPVGEESLAGGLSNTIAGRICNYFDLKGGGYTVDGACASSLLAVTTACSSLLSGDLDVALAGGVDLSLDPFEIVGFAKTGALAPEEMRVYDARSAGFWPGEGCGFVVLMRHEDALASLRSEGRRIYAVIRGWGVSSDGSGGITRPEVEGQILAVRRAYRRAGFGIDTVTYFEGHGTGTGVGDATELQALSNARKEAAPEAPPAFIGTIKANIGHTKAAAGVAGLIKATMALHAQIVPPTTGCEEPHPILHGDAPALQVLSEGRPWPADRALRAGVSAMGFGGINTHIALEGAANERRIAPGSRDRSLLSSAQDAELFLLGAQDVSGLRRQVERLLAIAPRLSRAELADLAAQLERTLDRRQVRAAVVASTPRELADRLETLRSWLDDGEPARLDPRAGVFLGASAATPRIGFLFPGQGSPSHLGGGVWRRRFERVRELYERADLPPTGDGVPTQVAQPAIVAASLAALRVLGQLDINGDFAVGHSLGELTAYHWAGALDEEAVLRIAAARGKAMAELGDPTGAMAGIRAGQREVQGLLNGRPVAIAGLNSPDQTVVSGDASGVAAVVARARARGLQTVSLPVSHAFHSPLVAAAAQPLADHLARETFQPPRRTVVSTVTGGPLAPDDDLRALLHRQVTEPVRFLDAMTAALDGVRGMSNGAGRGGDAREPSLLIEVGPGQVLTGLVSGFSSIPVVSLDAGGPSLKGLLQAAGAAFALGVPVNHNALFAGRFTRPFDLDWHPSFFVNPCELAPVPGVGGGVGGGGWGGGGPGTRSRRAIPKQSITRPLPLSTVPRRSQVLWGPQMACDPPPPPPPPPNPPPPPPPPDPRSPIPDPSPLDLVRQLVAERAELPPSAVRDDSRLLSDLHLNSIAVGQLVAEAARRLGSPPPVAPTEFADATVAAVAQALEELARTGVSPSPDEQWLMPPGVDTWVRAFTVELVERPLPRKPTPPYRVLSTQHSALSTQHSSSGWQVIAPDGHPLADALSQALSGWEEGGGIIVCLPPDPDESHVSLLLEGARAMLAGPRSPVPDPRPPSFVLVQHGGGAAAFAKTLHLEAAGITTCVVDVPAGHPEAADWVLAEVRAAAGYTEAHYDEFGKRREPVLRLLPPPATGEPAALPLGPEDVLLVTGGGKGIAAECALSLARETGARLALVGRSQPDLDAELSANLDRMTALGVRFRYVATDVTDAEAVRAAVGEVEADLGPVTAILHGAGANAPQLLSALDEEAFRRTLSPKVRGMRNALAAVNPDRLRLLVTFGSIIARTGMRGEADYALANEWLTRTAERWQADHPHCRCLALEWSVWSGIGMGERLGKVEALARQGVTPIPPDEGISTLRRLLTQPPPSPAVVVAGRFGEPPTLKMEQEDLPFLRFLERPRVYYPGVEFVVDADLSGDTDPYLDDHVYQGERLLPAVVGLEAMAQAAGALLGTTEPPVFEDVRFTSPVVIPEGAPVTLRLAALVREPGRVEVALRSEQTAFQVDHFRAIVRGSGIGDRGSGAGDRGPSTRETPTPDPRPPTPDPYLPLNPESDLYGEILFHTGRFRRLRGYRELKAKECLAEIGEVGPDGGLEWFGRYLPAELTLGDPAARDTAIHAVQACIPHGTILPTGVDRLVAGVYTQGPWLVRARERSHEGDTFTYDLEITGQDGCLVERWEGLRLRRVEERRLRRPWAEPLLGPYVERRVQELVPGAEVAVVVERDGGAERRSRSDQAIRRALGKGVPVTRRPDGKPDAPGDWQVSVAHAGDLTLAVAGPGPLGCDIEPVTPRPALAWHDLLGPDRLALAQVIARHTGEDDDTAATRVWAAGECLKKAGATLNAPLVLSPSPAKAPDGWVLLSSGRLAAATFVGPVRGIEGKLALAIVLSSRS